MKTINLAAPWSHHTIAVTTDYQAGTHEVTAEVYDAAVLAGVHKEEEVNGDGSATPRSARPAGKA
jgi:hypothetical protein